MNELYYYLDGAAQVGPLTVDDLNQLRSTGCISDTTLIWSAEMSEWKEYGAVFSKEVKEYDDVHQERENGSKSKNDGTHFPFCTHPALLLHKKRVYAIIIGIVTLALAMTIVAICCGDSGKPVKPQEIRKKIVKKQKDTSQKEVFRELNQYGVINSLLEIKSQPGVDALVEAARQGNKEIVELLLIGGTPVNEREDMKTSYGYHDSGSTALGVAAGKGYIDIVRLLLAAPGIDVKCGSPLSQAIGGGHAEIVKALLAAPGIDVNYGSPLGEAISAGRTDIIKLLLAAPGIDVNHESPLCDAVKTGQTEIIKLMLAAPGIDVNCLNRRYSHSPLEIAVEMGRVDVVKLLLAAPGIDPYFDGEPKNEDIRTLIYDARDRKEGVQH